MRKAPYGHGCKMKKVERECGIVVPTYKCKSCQNYQRKIRDPKTGKLVPEGKV